MRTMPLAVLALAAAAAAQQPAEKLDLAVLYAGTPDHPRTEQWREFLGAHVRTHGVAARTELSAVDAREYDVLIVDAPTPYEADGIDIPDGAPIGPGFDVPVILMGAAGGSTLRPFEIKLRWL